MFSTLIISNVLLWAVVILLAVVVLVLTRQIGVLHQRISPVGALMIDKGPAVGDPSPVFDLIDIQDQPFRLGGKQQDKNGQLLFFMSPDCPVCKSLLPALKSIYKDEKDWLEVVLVSDGKAKAEHLKLIETHDLKEFRYIYSAEVGMTFQIGKLPYSILINDGTIVAKGLCNTREHLESLLEANERNVASIQEYIHGANEPDAPEPIEHSNQGILNEVIR